MRKSERKRLEIRDRKRLGRGREYKETWGNKETSEMREREIKRLQRERENKETSKRENKET